MSTKETRKEIYIDARKATGINKRQWARLFALGKLGGNIMGVVGKKEKPEGEPESKGVNMPEALASELLKYLFTNGKDVAKIEFDESGRILEIPDRE